MVDRLKLVAYSEEFQDDREPPLRLGDVVQLNSGSPLCLIVDLPCRNTVVISWRESNGRVQEQPLPRACVHRVRFDRMVAGDA
jgi:hypothetical protein